MMTFNIGSFSFLVPTTLTVLHTYIISGSKSIWNKQVVRLSINFLLLTSVIYEISLLNPKKFLAQSKDYAKQNIVYFRKNEQVDLEQMGCKAFI